MTFTELAGHRAHDSGLLLLRWAALAKEAGLKWKRIGSSGAFPVCCAVTPARRGDHRKTIYISAGVHGDEAAPPWALLDWAEENVALLRAHRVLIFPCMNPHGIANNTRADHRGLDINRRFHEVTDDLTVAWRREVEPHEISIALCLHEDYDAQGCYVYELTKRKNPVGAKTLVDCASIIPPDARKKIDGRVARGGVIVRRVPPELPGLPEAIAVFNLGSPVSLTFETPSEYSLLDRIAAQKRFIASALHHAPGL